MTYAYYLTIIKERFPFCNYLTRTAAKESSTKTKKEGKTKILSFKFVGIKKKAYLCRQITRRYT